MRERARAPIAIAAIFAWFVLFSGTASAAPPANDNFANAQMIGLGTVAGTTVEATIETGEPDYTPGFPGPDAIASVWFAWNAGATPPENVRINVCGNGHGAAVYTGSSFGALSPVGTSGFSSCDQTFSPEPGTTYRISVFQSHEPLLHLQLTVRALNPPPNDDFGDAVTIPAALPQVVSGTAVDATKEPGEGTHGGHAGGGSVWYSWTPAASVHTKIEICPADGHLSPGISVYTGNSIPGLTEVGRTNGGFDCTVDFEASASTPYRIAVSGGEPFEFILRQLQPPSNDDLAEAQMLPGSLPQTVEGTLDDATHETAEPWHNVGPGPGGPTTPDASVWYAWTAPTGGEVVVDSCDWTDGGVSIAVYTGSSYEAPDPLVVAAANDGHCRQVITASPGTTYRIAVDGSREGPFEFEMHARDRPDNDDLASAQQIDPGPPRLVTGTTVDASAEAGEPSHGAGPSSSVWYRWNSGPGGAISMNACREEPVMLLAVYTGTAHANLTRVVGGDGRCLVHFTAAPNTEYRIAVDSQRVQEPFFLAIWQTDPPPNDAFAAAQALAGAGPLAVDGTNYDATTEPGEPGHGDPFTTTASVWYAWTAPASPETRTVNLDTCEGDFVSRLFVFTGSSLANLTEQTEGESCDENSFPRGERATFTATANQTYLIRVTGIGFQDAEGDFTLRLETAVPSIPPSRPSPSIGTPPAPAAEPEPERKKCKKGKKLRKGKCLKRGCKKVKGLKKGKKLKKGKCVKKKGKKGKRRR